MFGLYTEEKENNKGILGESEQCILFGSCALLYNGTTAVADNNGLCKGLSLACYYIQLELRLPYQFPKAASALQACTCKQCQPSGAKIHRVTPCY